MEGPCCCPCRMIVKLFTPSKEFGRMLGCIPLALFAILISCFLIIWGSLDIYQSVDHIRWPGTDLISCVILGCLKLLLGLIGIGSVLFKYAGGANCLVVAHKILTATVLISFIITWIFWIVDFSTREKDRPVSSKEIQYTIIFTLLHILYGCFAWWIMSCFASLGKLMSVGGSGWEKQNWKEFIGGNDDDS